MSELTLPACPETMNGGEPRRAWFCVRSQPRHEQIAAGHLGKMAGVEVFNPRVRFTRTGRAGRAVVTESMFPNYLFARFDWQDSLIRVHYAPGVSGVVHFGSKWPTVPDSVIAGLRAVLGQSGIQELSGELLAGELVELAGGPFAGLEVVVKQVMPGRQRVLVLMDFLGRQTTVEVAAARVIRHGARR
ncbi:MAG TPA: transcription termination/antitermination NusG family protein [Methylomirabilota bacterium]|nr:transcription termination/antitermination NusG family protein [Methylomirabilota bacterium]